MEVKSVYNFVPAPNEEEVFKPNWANLVSHDIPFSDAESGEIEITIEAKTPIFIRNGHSKKDAEEKNDRYLSFSHVIRNGQKQFFIPGSSLKGMIRNVLEIMSFGRMKQVEDNRYAYRDLTRNSLYMNNYKSTEVLSGWLEEKKDGSWVIYDCGQPDRITLEEIDNIFETNFKEEFYKNRDGNRKKKLTDKQRTAEYKYKKIKEKTGTLLNEINGRILVFTGQPSFRDEENKKGKNKEFLFKKPEECNKERTISKRQKQDFLFIYKDYDKNEISPDWKFWKEQLKQGKKIPVFFIPEGKDSIKHFGLAFMYKLPYKHSINELYPVKSYKEKDKDNLDLADVIFGTIENDKLKGRVYFGHAFAIKAEEDIKRQEILATPKASYYPFYLKQPKNDNKYYTYEDDDAELRGYKRYYTQTKIWSGNYTPEQEKNTKVFTHFIPLKQGAVFKGRIRFHNLRKAEIGALISALTFHGTEDKSYHSIGQAKPFGFGLVKITIELKNLQESKEDYLAYFEEIIKPYKKKRPDIWEELFYVAQYPNENARYPKDPKEFVNYKKQYLFLEPYSFSIKPQKIRIPQYTEDEELIATIRIILEKDDIQTYRKLKEALSEFDHIPLPLQPQLIEKIKEIYYSHERSKNKLNKDNFNSNYEWHSIIAKWLGQEKALVLYKELTGKEN